MELLKIINYIKEGENDKIEFKKKVVSEIGKDVCAFLNTSGGVVLVGVDDNGNIIGVKEKELLKLSNILSYIYPTPKVNIEKIKIGEKTIIVIEVKKSNYLHVFSSIPYIRVGEISKPLSFEESLVRAGETALFKYDLEMIKVDDNFSEELLEKYFGKKKNLKKLLSKTSFCNGEKCKIGFILSFHKYPENYIPESYVELKIGNKLRTIKGPIPKIIDNVISFFENEKYILLNPSLKHISSLPIIAIREGITNALIHKNYLITSPVRIFVGKEIVIENPGNFPPGTSPEKPRHVARNPLICEIMQKLGYIEKFGTGIEKMKNILSGTLWNQKYEIDDLFTKLIFYPSFEELNEKELIVLETIRRNEGIKAKRLEEITGMKRKTILRILKKLIEKGLVLKKGKGKNTTYWTTNS